MRETTENTQNVYRLCQMHSYWHKFKYVISFEKFSYFNSKHMT